MCQLNNNELNSAYHWTKSQLIFFLFNWPIINWHGYNTLNNFMFNWPNINWHRYRPKGWKLSGCEEIITSFRIHGLDQLWLGSLWFGSRGESRQWMTASRNTILRCGLDQDMKCCQGLEEIITPFRIHGLEHGGATAIELQQLNYNNWNTTIELQQLNYLLVQ